MFNFLSRNRKRADAAPVIDTTTNYTAGSVTLPHLVEGNSIEVLTDDRKLIATARLASSNRNNIILERLPGCISLPVFEEGTRLVLRGLTEDNQEFMLEAIVKYSGRIKLELVDQEPIAVGTQRESIRYTVTGKAEIYDLDSAFPTKVYSGCLKNISLTGACVNCDRSFLADHVLRVRVELYKKAGPISFKCQIIRCNQLNDGEYEYGLLFEQLDQRRLTYLKEDLAEVQKRSKSRWRR